MRPLSWSNFNEEVSFRGLAITLVSDGRKNDRHLASAAILRILEALSWIEDANREPKSSRRSR